MLKFPLGELTFEDIARRMPPWVSAGAAALSHCPPASGFWHNARFRLSRLCIREPRTYGRFAFLLPALAITLG